MKLSILHSKCYISLAIFIVTSTTSLTLLGASSREQTQLRLKAALDKLTDVTPPTSVEIKTYKSSTPAARTLVRALDLQAQLMDAVKDHLLADQKSLMLYYEQQRLMQLKNTIACIPNVFSIQSPPESALAIAFKLRYGFLLGFHAEDLLDEYAPLVAELEFDLPIYLASENSEVQTSARKLKNKIEQAKAKTSCGLERRRIKALFKYYSNLNPQKQKIIQYPAALQRHMNTYRESTAASIDTYKKWLAKLEYLHTHYQKNAPAIQKHREALSAPEQKMDTPLPEWATESARRSRKKKKSASKRSAEITAVPPLEASSQDTSNEPILDIDAIDGSSDDIFSSAASSIVAPSAITASSSTDSAIKSIKADGSYVEHKTNIIITIQDPKNNTVIKLFRIQKPTAPAITDIILAFNVKLWMADSNHALEELGYTTPGHKNYNDPQAYTYLRRIHSFGLAADDYVSQCGIAQENPDRINPEQINTMILMPGSYSYDDEQGRHVEKIGLFTYILNRKTNKIFHRMFHTYQGKNLIEEYNEKGIWDVDINQL